MGFFTDTFQDAANAWCLGCGGDAGRDPGEWEWAPNQILDTYCVRPGVVQAAGPAGENSQDFPGVGGGE